MHASPRYWLIGCLVVLLCGTFPVAIGVGHLLAERHCGEAYSLLNPVRRCRDDNPPKREFETFRDELAAQLEENEQLKNIEVALYFRDLQAGPWFGINEQREFFPASLTKVPTMIALLKLAEQHPEILKQEIGLEDPPPVARSVPAEMMDKTIVLGQGYPAEEVLRRSIVYSDNYSDFLLRMFLTRITDSRDFLLKAFQEMGFVAPDADTLILSVKEYTSLFRILYNSQFLNREMSQKALELLASSDARGGLRAQLPASVRVAHKFGYYPGNPAKKELAQLHDCGIVYHPATPYTLCIMTRGKDIEIMQSVIAELSKIVYDEVAIRSQTALSQ